MAKKTIAIIGSGITGLSVAWHLNPSTNVVLFEKEERLGGHTHTHHLKLDDNLGHVDSGFIVFNKVNYPNFFSWLTELQVEYNKAEMSFSVSKDSGRFEWSGKSIFSLFGQMSNIWSYDFYLMIKDVIRFNSDSKILLSDSNAAQYTIGDFLDKFGYSHSFRENYLFPMAGAIWSTPVNKILEYPAVSLINFFANHGLLGVGGHHQWFSIENGSTSYINKFKEKIGKEMTIHLGHKVQKVGCKSKEDKICISGAKGKETFSLDFDAVFFCCHADQTVKIINESNSVFSILKKFKFQKNFGYLHNDDSLMPKRKVTWSAWNYRTNNKKLDKNGISITYWMNKLQNLNTKKNLFVTLNAEISPANSSIKIPIKYQHPIFDFESLSAKKDLAEHQGTFNFWYAGAWLGNGFHEDGFSAGMGIAKAFNKIHLPNFQE